MDGRQLRFPVVERRRAGAMADVRRVDLELHVEDEGLVLWDVAECELEPSVVTRLTRRARLDRVDRHALRPACTEHQDRVLDLPMRRDVNAALPEQAATQCRRRV